MTGQPEALLPAVAMDTLPGSGCGGNGKNSCRQWRETNGKEAESREGGERMVEQKKQKKGWMEEKKGEK